MRYVPNLIQEDHKVLKHYFRGSLIHSSKKDNSFQFFLRWIVGIFFLLFALISLKHLILTLLFGFIGFIILPPGHNWIEKRFRFRFTTKIKTILGFTLFLFSLPLLGHYSTIDKKEAHLLKLKIEHEERVKAALQKKEQIRNDSLTFYINASSELGNKHKLEEASKQLEKAILFAELPVDREKISNERDKISTIKVFDLVKSGKYKSALPLFDRLINKDGNNSNLFYNRALCYSKTGKIGEAVSDCNMAMKLGDVNAEKLYNKINPIKRRIAYYVTRCCDGSTSSSSGRGTCSHHGGVCNWSEPVYEEYRKYE